MERSLRAGRTVAVAVLLLTLCNLASLETISLASFDPAKLFAIFHPFDGRSDQPVSAPPLKTNYIKGEDNSVRG
jgi:hypothetical protein